MRVIAGLAWVVPVMALLAGCSEEVRHLDWEVRFATPADQAETVALQARILEDGCGGSTSVWLAEIDLTGTASAPSGPPRLTPGTYGFAVEARDATCTRIARGCTELRLPRAEGSLVIVDLGSDRAPSAECDLASCRGGICETPDAGTTDGGMPDAGPCPSGTGDCNYDPADGCETALDTLLDCRACGARCEIGHATASCGPDGCEVAACEAGYADCNASGDDGCETPLGTVANCDACGAACNFAHAGSSCDGGTCSLGTCHPGWADCDGMAANGCEQSLASASHCGACGTVCDPVLAPVCGVVVSAMGPARSCLPACVAPAPTACGTSCFDLTTDPLSCGACDTPCSPIHATAACVMGVCGTETCDPGWGDCNATSGCETSLRSTTDCGGCGSSCVRPHAVSSCGTGTCTVDACLRGWDDCDDDAGNGCEADLAEPLHCGECAMSCGGAMPVCGTRGGDPACLPSCVDPAPTRCGDRCFDTRTDESNCGGCDMACTFPGVAESACVDSTCRIGRCENGFADCDGDPANGCEAQLGFDVAHCGECGRSCPSVPNAGATCIDGACGISCLDGFGDCDDVDSTGCEADLDSDETHCGNCTRRCMMRTCVNGRCE